MIVGVLLSCLRELLLEIRVAKACAIWIDGIRGLTLNLQLLEQLGADRKFLNWWRNGRPLEAQPVVPRVWRNHRSLMEASTWAEKEWSRLDSLGKIEFFLKGKCQRV